MSYMCFVIFCSSISCGSASWEKSIHHHNNKKNVNSVCFESTSYSSLAVDSSHYSLNSDVMNICMTVTQVRNHMMCGFTERDSDVAASEVT